MEENLENKPESTEEVPQENITVSDAMTGVITEPGDTLEAVKTSTKRNYWVTPIIILGVIYLVSSFLVMNDEELYSEIKEKQMTAMKERLDKAVKEGKMTQEQVNESIEKADKMFSKSNPLFYVFPFFGVVMVFISLFFRGLIFWGALKLFKGTASYILVICVLGLAAVIDSIQAVIDTVMAIFMGKLNANIGPALLFSKEAVGDKMMTFLAHFDLFNFWWLIVVGIGLAKVSNLKSSQTLPVVIALWLVWISATTFLGLPFGR
jgi:Yip1-like protein